MLEIWKNHPLSSKYKISNLGNVVSYVRYKDGKELTKNVGSDGYVRYNFIIDGKPTSTRAHRIVAELFVNNFDSLKIVDHIDRDRTNNNICNLRMVDPSGNSRNSSSSKNSSSKYKGVYFCQDRNKWAAEIMKDGKHYALGRFVSEELAASAYDAKCSFLHGKYATTNKTLGLL